MAATALLSSPRTPSATGGIPSPSRSSNSKTQRLSAAADLIRNLDAALSGMNAAAANAAEDAARARRNAKAAGEVARRYGAAASKGGRKKRGDKGSGGGTNANAASHESLLERKRERRAAARMAAEARQRREHPLLHATSPRNKVTTPRSARVGAFRFANGENENEVSWTSPIDKDRKMMEVGSTRKSKKKNVDNEMSMGPVVDVEGKDDVEEEEFQSFSERVAEAGTVTVTHYRQALVVDQGGGYIDSQPVTAPHATVAPDNIVNDNVSSIPLATEEDNWQRGGTFDSSDFEDAMEHHYHDPHIAAAVGIEGEESNNEVFETPGKPSRKEAAEGQEQLGMEDEQYLQNDMDGGVEGMEGSEGAPPTNNEYYMQQHSYYNNQQQQTYYQSEQPVATEQVQPQGLEGNEQQQNAMQQGYYDQNQYYYNQQQQQQQAYSYATDPSAVEEPQQAQLTQQQQVPQETAAPTLDAQATTTATATTAASYTPKQSPRTTTNRIEASHAEDVLTLSLELERTRSQLASTSQHLSNATIHVGELKAQNSKLQSELSTLHSQLESTNERSSTLQSTLEQQLDAERIKSTAAEEDATLALELAKEAQSQKEECEMWLGRCLEEIDLWKGRFAEAEVRLHELEQLKLNERQNDVGEVQNGKEDVKEKGEEYVEETKKSVRFKDECPPSPVVSDDGFGYEGDVEAKAAVSSPSVQKTPPPPPPPPPRDGNTEWSTPQGNKENDGTPTDNSVMSNINSGVFNSPTASSPTSTTTGSSVVKETPSKAAIASGRAFLHRNSPSPLKMKVGGGRSMMSPHPRLQASELLKKSAETRRLLRERLAPGYGHSHHLGGGPRPPTAGMMAQQQNNTIPRVSSDPQMNNNNDGGFASRQGAACRAVGRTIRESGARLNLSGAWWSEDSNGSTPMLTNGSGGSESGTVAQLESMVRDYCGNVEGTIGKQKERIDELLAFCDHLEREVVLLAK